jgi:hypothetical protein
MSHKIKSIAQINQKSIKSKNKELIDALIKNYQDKTKSAVEKIIDMCIAVQEVDEKLKNNEITSEDMDYFCASISLNRNGSTYRKYMRIAAKANVLKMYMEKLPSASSVLYEITTLNPDVFNDLIENGDLNSQITLEQLKKLTKKVPAKNKSEYDVELKITINTKEISKANTEILKNFMFDAFKSNEIFLSCTDKSDRFFMLEKVKGMVLDQ